MITALDRGQRSAIFGVLTAIGLAPLLTAWVLVGVVLPRVTGSARPGLQAWLAAIACAAGLVIVLRILAERIVARVAGPSERAVADLSVRLARTERESGDRASALTESMGQFGRALQNTHNADALLRSVAEAARSGATAGAGIAVIYLGDAKRLTEQITLVPDSPGAVPDPALPRLLDQVASLASRAAVRAEPCRGELTPPFRRAMAVPILNADRVLGVIAVAAPAGSRPPIVARHDPMGADALSDLAAATAVALNNVQEHIDTQRLSITDPLTGIGNVRHLLTTLSREVGRAQRFGRNLSVLMLDLDHFKDVNDWGGHAFGDAVLREFAERLRGCVREVDLVARRGGEEFALVLPETGSAGAQAVMHRILERVRSEPFRDGGLSRTVTVSIGVASYPEHGRRADELLAAADSALYAAKRAGRDRGCVAPSPAPASAAGLVSSGQS